MALVGTAFLIYSVWMGWWSANVLKRQGRPHRWVWRRMVFTPFFLLGLLFTVGSVSDAGAAMLFGLYMTALIVAVAVLVARGVRSIPGIWRHLRALGDPDAWRGTGVP